MSTICQGCRDGAAFDLPITMAFQPIVDLEERRVFAHEALVRGAGGEGAAFVLERVTDASRYAFDQTCRVKAIELASQLGIVEQGTLLSINFLPNAVYEPRACIRSTLQTAMRTGFPVSQILFEFTEAEKLDAAHVLTILRAYRSMGFKTAIDDFGGGYAGLGLLVDFQPDYVKLDMGLIRGIDRDRARQVVVGRTLEMLRDLGVIPICEGVETQAEQETLAGMGVRLMQGYLFARPGLSSLPEPAWPRPGGDQRRVARAGA
ncbi:EAL domain-containing protein [uncultured Alsobacter sp.]|uniref:EAL domain-containing protein n=1 Tax=uncultured Alsobacter sp. TaxID=1748258 RepID=UPI0025F73A49|nr:EAL domain-containing protein [uncultured Alsobacter sp.]